MASGARLTTRYGHILSNFNALRLPKCLETAQVLERRPSRRFSRQSHAPQCRYLLSSTQQCSHNSRRPKPQELHSSFVVSRPFSKSSSDSPHHAITDQTKDDSLHTNTLKKAPDPFQLVQEELATLCDDIRKELSVESQLLGEMTHYHFDGAGKAFRPMIIMLMAITCNKHRLAQERLLSTQRKIAIVAEMIHTSSLIHDDIIDAADTRRGKPSIQASWGQKYAVLTGNYIMAAASVILAQTRHVEVVKILSQVLQDLVSGEFMQLGSKEDESERFNHYLSKTYKKTASLIANSCKAVAVLGGCDEDFVEYAYQYGRNVGIAFQLVDDLLDFISTEELMGKPAAADLQLGLATAPVLFAAHQYPELNAMIMRRFSKSGDVEKAWDLVKKSDGISHTRYLAHQHCNEAIKAVSNFLESDERNGLIALTQKVINRLK